MISPKKRILVIDDDEAVFAYLQRTLGHLYELVTTTEPESAIYLAMKEQPDLILCDVDMPVVNGVELSCRLFECKRTRKIPLAYLTSFVSAEIPRLRDNAAVRRVIAKAMPAEELIPAIERMLL